MFKIWKSLPVCDILKHGPLRHNADHPAKLGSILQVVVQLHLCLDILQTWNLTKKCRNFKTSSYFFFTFHLCRVLSDFFIHEPLPSPFPVRLSHAAENHKITSKLSKFVIQALWCLQLTFDSWGGGAIVPCGDLAAPSWRGAAVATSYALTW